MQDDQFEWHDAKAASNWRNHNITFAMAREAFRDAFAIEWVDVGQDTHEERFVLIGMVANRLLYVSYTLRGQRTRLISARLAEPHERRRYHNENRET
jgi:uncharacterized DUF497 family protein